MIVKRFTMGYKVYHDNLTGIDYNEITESYKICDLLNDLSEENERVKSIIETGIIDFELNIIENPIENLTYTIGTNVLRDLYRELYGDNEYGRFLANESAMRDKRKKEREEELKE